VAGWDAGFGVQNFGGKSTVTGPVLGAVTNEPKAPVVDAQLQGDVADLPVGFYASYATAPAGTATAINPFALNAELGGANAATATSFNVAAEVGIIPHEVVLQAAYRNAKNGLATDNADNALMVGVVYDLAQNIVLSYTHTSQFGSAWNTVAGTQGAGRVASTLLLETLF
jgi:hypothetical protein